MADQNAITLYLTIENVETQCLDAIKQTRTPSHALAALITLQSFVSATAHEAARHSPSYEAIQSTIEKHMAATRANILTENADALAEAIRLHKQAAIAHIHSTLSRNGFWQAAQQAIRQFQPDERTLVAAWIMNWCRDAKSLAQAASGYPDALDFNKAGIAITEYTAMTEIDHYFSDFTD